MAVSQSAYDRLLQTVRTTSNTIATARLGPRTEAAERRQQNAINEAERRMSPSQFREFISAATAATTGENSPRSSTTDYPGADAARERTLSRIGGTAADARTPAQADALARVLGDSTTVAAQAARGASSPASAGTGNS
jgi:hypothetical protein